MNSYPKTSTEPFMEVNLNCLADRLGLLLAQEWFRECRNQDAAEVSPLMPPERGGENGPFAPLTGTGKKLS